MDFLERSLAYEKTACVRQTLQATVAAYRQAGREQSVQEHWLAWGNEE